MKKLTVEYDLDSKVAYFNGLRFVKDEKKGYYQCTRQLDGHRKRLHVVVWEHFNGPKPEGFDIHHIDGDKDNNEIDNLFCITRTEHRRYHYFHMSDEHRQKFIDNNAWQYTEEGREWHAQARREAWENVEPKEYVCSHCGEAFSSRRSYGEHGNRFCSIKCKNAHRYVKLKTTTQSKRTEGDKTNA